MPDTNTKAYSLRYRIAETHGTALVSNVTISPNGKLIATCSSDKTIKLWDAQTGQLQTTLRGHNDGVSDIAFSYNNMYLASASDDLTIRIWEPKLEKTVKIMKNHTYHVNCIKFDQRSRILVSGSSDENIRIWDCKRGRSMRTLSAHSDPISSLDLCFDDTIIVSGSYDGLIRLFDTQTGGCLKTLIYDKEGSSFPISNVVFSPNGKFILSSSLDGALRLWDYMNNLVVKTYKGVGGAPVAEKYCLGANFVINDGQLLINSGDEHGRILFWDIQSQEIKYTLNASISGSPIIQVRILEEGKTMVSVSLDGELCVWDYNC